jgi:tyrosinase
MFLKSHSRISADIWACRHIGIGLSVTIHHSLFCIYNSDSWIDASNFYESSFWKDSDPESGLGGWGDPNADFAVPDGGFHSLHLSYPVPHIVRRNFSLFAFDRPPPNPMIPNPLEMVNTSFTPSVIKAILETSDGDYKGFQKVLEALEVRKMDISDIERVSSS